MENEIVLTKLTCLRCVPPHTWVPRATKMPKCCPKCKSPYWNKPRRSANEVQTSAV